MAIFNDLKAWSSRLMKFEITFTMVQYTKIDQMKIVTNMQSIPIFEVI